VVARRVEEGACCIVPEPVNRRVGERARAREPDVVEGELVERERGEPECRIVLEVARDSRLPMLVRAEDTLVANERPEEKLAMTHGVGPV
jgi:hypothetical protein